MACFALSFILSILLLNIVFGFTSHSEASVKRIIHSSRSQRSVWKGLKANKKNSFEEAREQEYARKMQVADPSKPIEGYLNPDLSKMDEGKVSRVAAYILIALLPCLLLVPFYMSRSFQPPDL